MALLCAAVEASYAQIVVHSAADLQGVIHDMAANYVLGADIDLSGVGNLSPIGVSAGSADPIPFTGTLDGAGHTIYGLSQASSGRHAGLFGLIGAGGSIRSLRVQNASITSNYSGGSAAVGSAIPGMIGILAGEIRQGTIDNVTVNGVIVSTSSRSACGGFVGVNRGTISNSYAFVTLTATLKDSVVGPTDQSTQIGAIAGRNDAAITKVTAAGTISVQLDATVDSRAVFGAQVGGLVGLSESGSSVAGSSSSVNISAAFSGSSYAASADNPYTTYWNAVGGLVGNAPSSSTIADSFSSGAITVTNAVKTAGGVPRDTIGGLLGSGGIIGPGADVNPAGTPTITGSSASGPISSLGMFGSSPNVGGLVGQIRGTIISSYASGSVEVKGQGFSIVGGLVGSIMSGVLTGVKASGSLTSVNNGLGVDFGGLAGTSGAVVTNAISSGTVSSSMTQNLPQGVKQGSTIGGLVGFNTGVIKNALALGSVTATFAGSVSGSGSFYGDTVAGLVANNVGAISNSSAWGTVSLASTITASGGGASDKVAGGLVGGGYATSLGTSTVVNSFAAGEVSASGANDRLMVGALMGYNASSIASSYALGKLSIRGGVGNTVGGFVGRNETRGSITSSYWDVSKTGLTTGVGSGTATGATNWSAAPAALPAGFEPAAWGLTPAVNSGYPCLLWQSACAARGSLPDSDRIFNFAEAIWPQAFGIASPPSATSLGYYYRFYDKTGFYLATSAGNLYLCWLSLDRLYWPTGLGQNVFDLGPVSWWLVTAKSAGF